MEIPVLGSFLFLLMKVPFLFNYFLRVILILFLAPGRVRRFFDLRVSILLTDPDRFLIVYV